MWARPLGRRCIKSLKYGGTLVTCGATTGFDASLDLRVLFARQLSFHGSYMGSMGELDEVLKHVFCRQAEAGCRQDLSAERNSRRT